MAAPWRTLLQQSLRRNEKIRHSKYLQIATVRPDGRPSNRTVVYRGFLWDTDSITFVTDSRSGKQSCLHRREPRLLFLHLPLIFTSLLICIHIIKFNNTLSLFLTLRSKKVEDLALSPWAEIAWYFPDSREQYRLLGKVTVITKDTPPEEKLGRARVGAWKAMSDPGRQQFTWPHPGLPRATGEEDEAAFAEAPPSKDEPVADPFCLCFIEVEEVDLLDLKSNQRRTFRRGEQGGEWEETSVNP